MCRNEPNCISGQLSYAAAPQSSCLARREVFSWNRIPVGSVYKYGSLVTPVRSLMMWPSPRAVWLAEACLRICCVMRAFCWRELRIDLLLDLGCCWPNVGRQIEVGQWSKFTVAYYEYQLAGGEGWRSFFLWKGPALLKSFSAGSPRASHSPFFRPPILRLIIQLK